MKIKIKCQHIIFVIIAERAIFKGNTVFNFISMSLVQISSSTTGCADSWWNTVKLLVVGCYIVTTYWEQVNKSPSRTEKHLLTNVVYWYGNWIVRIYTVTEEGWLFSPFFKVLCSDYYQLQSHMFSFSFLSAEFWSAKLAETRSWARTCERHLETELKTNSLFQGPFQRFVFFVSSFVWTLSIVSVWSYLFRLPNQYAS